MRNILLGASAIAIVGATPVPAAEWTVRVGDYGEVLLGSENSAMATASLPSATGCSLGPWNTACRL